ncbi:MAG: type II toxin-antitoxin system VapC family toxin [Dehalococcoidia bacterium]
MITYGEIVEGLGNESPDSPIWLAFRQLLRGVDILDVTTSIADTWASLRRSLRRQGTPLPDADLLIAATAIFYDLPLLTRNVRHFDRVPGLRLG